MPSGRVGPRLIPSRHGKTKLKGEQTMTMYELLGAHAQVQAQRNWTHEAITRRRRIREVLGVTKPFRSQAGLVLMNSTRRIADGIQFLTLIGNRGTAAR
jgi:hypothetical protein